MYAKHSKMIILLFKWFLLYDFSGIKKIRADCLTLLFYPEDGLIGPKASGGVVNAVGIKDLYIGTTRSRVRSLAQTLLIGIWVRKAKEDWGGEKLLSSQVLPLLRVLKSPQKRPAHKLIEHAT